MTLTDAAALTSLVLSGSLLGWTIYRDLWDRGRLKIEVELVTDSERCVGSSLCIALLIVNTGRRVVNAVGIMAEFENGEAIHVLVPSLPKHLGEQEHISAFVADVNVLEAGPVAFYIFDPTGRKWYANKKDMRFLWNTYRREVKGQR